MTTTNPSQAYFESVAGHWDDLRQGYFTEEVRSVAISKAYLRPEMVVADVGGGTGFMSAGLAPLVKQVHIIDGSGAMLEEARLKLAIYNNIVYHQADGLSIPLPDDSLDAVFANMYLHHCPDPLAAIREMIRLLRPGGRLVLTDMDAHPYTWLKDEMSDYWQGFDRRQVAGWLAEADLVNGIVDSTGQSCNADSDSPSTPEEQRQAKISLFVAVGTKSLKGIHESVLSSYSTIAQGGSSCCSPQPVELKVSSSCCTPELITLEEIQPLNAKNHLGYDLQELSAIPQEAADISLGCGNPLAIANLQEGEVVVDIGSGGGIDAFLAAQKVGITGHVIGVDMTQAMLERARQSAEKAGISNVEFRQGYAESLPVQDASIDVIMSNCVINLTEDKGKVFREAFRALKPSGRLEISDIVTSSSMPLIMIENKAEWAECVSGALPEGEYLDLIRQAGFTDITTRRSAASGSLNGVEIYSLLVSAHKPGI